MENERALAAIMHGLNLLTFFIGPLIVWLLLREKSAYLDEQGKEAVNFGISYAIYSLVAGISAIILIGFILAPIVGIAYFIFAIVGIVNVINNGTYRYPLIIRFIR
ncbi:MAG: DUF4870 domain-containing protein [Bacilli bacterium]